jgi:hypothetical protein
MILFEKKRKTGWFLPIAALLLCLITSCSGETDALQDEESIDWSLLQGEWTSTTTQDHWYFDNDGTGLYWDASESNREEAATGSGKFRWQNTATGINIYHWQTALGDYSDPDSGNPFLVRSLTSSYMTWTENNGKGADETFRRVN